MKWCLGKDDEKLLHRWKYELCPLMWQMVIGEWITFYINNVNVIKNVFNMSIYHLDKIENNLINMKYP
jgi:hypothetical protein